MAQSPGHEPTSSSSASTQVYLVLALLVTAVVLYLPMVANLDRSVRDPGDPLLNAAILAWDVRALTTAPGRLFDAPWFYPDHGALAYSEHLLGSVPLVAPILLATGNPILAANVLLLLAMVLSGWGTFLLVRHWTGHTWAAVVAAFLFAFSPYRCAQISHVQLVTTQWLPFVLLYLDRWLRGQRWRDCLGLLIFFNLQFLSSYYIGLFMGLTVALLAAGYWALRLAPLNRRLLGQLALWLLLTGASNLPLVLPYQRMSHAQGTVRSIGEAALYSARPASYLTANPHHPFYGPLTAGLRNRPDFSMEQVLFLGLIPWLLALVGIAAVRRAPLEQKRLLGLLTVLLGVLVVLSLGPLWSRGAGEAAVSLPYRLLYDHVPGFQGLRAPARLMTVISLLVAVLAGWGVSRLLPAKRSLGAWGAVLLVGLFLAEVGPQWQAGMPMPTGADLPAVYRWLGEQPPGQVTLELPITDNLGQWPFHDAPRLYFGAYHHQPLVNGYSGLLPASYAATIRACAGFPDARSLARLRQIGVRYVVLSAGGYTPAQWEALQGRLRAAQETWPVVQEFPDALVLAVR